MPQQTPKSRRINYRAHRRIVELAHDVCMYSPKQILDALCEDEDLDPGKIPSPRTVEEIVKETRPRDKSEPWSLPDSRGSDAPVVLAVLAAVVEATRGRKDCLTIAEAEWVATINRAAPDLPPRALYALALAYMKRQEGSAGTADLDQFLAFAPWRAEDPAGGWEDYRELARTGVVKELPISGLLRAYCDSKYREGLRILGKDPDTGEEYSSPVTDDTLSSLHHKKGGNNATR